MCLLLQLPLFEIVCFGTNTQTFEWLLSQASQDDSDCNTSQISFVFAAAQPLPDSGTNISLGSDKMTLLARGVVSGSREVGKLSSWCRACSFHPISLQPGSK